MPAWLPPSVRGTALLTVPLLALALVANAVATPAELRVVVNFFVALVLVLSIQSFSGNSGIVSFGHVAFMGVGAYTAALLTIPPAIKQFILPELPSVIAHAHVGFLQAVLISTVVGALVAAVIGVPLMRMQEGAMAMATIGVLVIFFVVFDNWDAVTRGSTGVFGIPRNTSLLSAVILSLIAIFVCRVFRESNAGLKLRASRADPVAAEALGANVVHLRYVAWVLSGAIMGMGGAIWAQYNLAFDPKQFFFTQTFNLLAMVVVGGLASVSGAVIGAATVTLTTEIMRRIEDSVGVPGLTQMAVALLILLILYRRPDGLVGRSEVDDLIRRRLSRLRPRGADSL
jgi:branched-chain amino acid transport system ATP-binding protein/branched-chain amino acid transport system permease protein